MVRRQHAWTSALNPVLLGTAASLLVGGATAIGAAAVFLSGEISERAQDTLLGFAAGVMLSASFFSLLLPALEAAEGSTGGSGLAAIIAGAGLVLGVAALWLVNERVPHEHLILGREGRDAAGLARVWLFVIAIAIHNFPEGLAVGVGFAGTEHEKAMALAIGIGLQNILQNIPKGMAVAVALAAKRYSKMSAFPIGGFIGLLEPVGAFLGAAAVTVLQPPLPWALAFAADAMIYVVSHEIISETHRHGFQKWGTAGLTGGLVIMMGLDYTLG